MQLGMIGLGRMGANLVRRLMRDGHECVVYDVNADAVEELAGEGATAAGSLAELRREARGAARRLDHGPGRLRAGHPRRARRADGVRATRSSTAATPTTATTSTAPQALKPTGIDYIDVGTSGGVFGLERGFCLMIGGPDDAVSRLDPIFKTIAPGVDSAERTPGRGGEPTPGRERLSALRPDRRGALREDGPQRDRVRRHGRLRRGPERDPERRPRLAQAGDRRRDDPAPRPAVLPLRHRHRRRRRGLAPRLGDRLLAARPDRQRAQGLARRSTASAVASPTRARAAGRCTRRSTRASRRRC